MPERIGCVARGHRARAADRQWYGVCAPHTSKSVLSGWLVQPALHTLFNAGYLLPGCL